MVGHFYDFFIPLNFGIHTNGTKRIIQKMRIDLTLERRDLGIFLPDFRFIETIPEITKL
ncbi:hypothetical protein D3C85_1564720 [compost metagenome]